MHQVVYVDESQAMRTTKIIKGVTSRLQLKVIINSAAEYGLRLRQSPEKKVGHSPMTREWPCFTLIHFVLGRVKGRKQGKERALLCIDYDTIS